MNKFWKWFLIILGVFALLALVAMPFAHHGGFYAERGFGRYPMGGGFMAFHMLGGGLRMLFPLLLLGGLIWFFLDYAKTRRALLDQPAATPAVPPAARPACVKCGGAIEAGWVACPHCGRKV